MEKIEDYINKIDTNKEEIKTTNLKKYLKYWYLFLLFGIIGTISGFLLFKYSPNIYQVQSRILVKEQNEQLNSILPSQNNFAKSMGMGQNSNIENKIGILQSYTLFRKALTNLDWKVSWYKKEVLYNKELYNNEPFNLSIPPNAMNAQDVLIQIEAINNNEYHIQAKGQTSQNGYLQDIEIDETAKFGKPYNNDFFNFTLSPKKETIKDAYYLKFNNINSLTNHYLSKTEITSDQLGSDIITISVKDQSIRKEADFINELNEVFIQFGLENKNVSSKQSLEFIESQLSRIKTKLKTAEDNFSNFRRNNKVMNLSQEAQIVYEKLEKIENEKYMTQLQINYYRDLLKYLDNSDKISEMVNPSVIGINDASLSGMLTKLMDLYSKREVLSYSVKEKNPSFQILEKEIKITRDGLEETVKNQLQATEAMLASAEDRYKTIEQRVKQLPQTEKQMIGIQREFDLNNDLYTYLLQKRAEASLAKASIMPEIQIIDPAMQESAKLVGPNRLMNIGGGLIAGLSIPFIFITILFLFNTRIESRDEVESKSEIRVLDGIIKHNYKTLTPVVQHPRSGIAESFRGLRTNISTILESPRSKVISINSLLPGEGKSFISSNFSITLAQSKKKTLLIGADLYKPTLHKFLNIKENKGLSEYFKGDLEMKEIIYSTSIPNLHFIQAGSSPQNPSELIVEDKLRQLLEMAREMYDYIVIDNAPLMLVPDAVTTSNYADISLFIVRMFQSHKEQVKQINKIVSFNKIEQAAIVINGSPDRGYGYGKKYWKKGYGESKYNMNNIA